MGSSSSGGVGGGSGGGGGGGSSSGKAKSVVILAVCLVMFGCCLNNIALELIIREDTAAGNAVTFFQFVAIAIEGFFVHLTFHDSASSSSVYNSSTASRIPRLLPRRIPLVHYILMVIVFFTVSTINNAALAFHISMPFHMVFRSGSLISSALLGRFCFGKRYSLGQYAAVLIVSIGIFIATLSSATSREGSVYEEEPFSLDIWLAGITMLLVALVLSSLLGFYQEWCYNQYKGDAKEKPYRETMFYSHLLALPCFVLVMPDIMKHIQFWSTLPGVTLPVLGTVPYIWLNLLSNVITQYICIRGVFMLTGNLAPLSTTLVISIRKFVSLIFSVQYFGNAFTTAHWIGTILVFGGTFLYTTASQAPSTKQMPDAKSKAS